MKVRPRSLRVLDILGRMLGGDHPDTGISLNNLAILPYNKGGYDGAITYFREALVIFDKISRYDNPNTVAIRENIKALGG